MRKALFTILLFAPFFVYAQVSIQGKVIANEGKAAIAGASIFLSNTRIGAASADSGAFTLKNVHDGKYELVITFVGHEPYKKDIMVNGADVTLPVIELLPKVNMLKEIRIGNDDNRAKHLLTFTREFLGDGANARHCKILNPEVINLTYSRRSGVLKANSDDFILIENRALGYTVKYLLQSFTLSNNQTKLFVAGSSVFEPLSGTPEEEAAWAKKRLEVFTGSAMHFLRSSLHNQLVEESFTVKNNDGKLNEQQLLRRTDKDGVYALTSPKELVIRHGKRHETVLAFHEKYVFFDMNGVILNPQSNTMKGFWGSQRIAELLPVDYRRPTDFQ